MLSRGAFPDCCDAFGSTPVFYAVLHGCEESLALLLEAQADPSLRTWDRVRYSPIEWAMLLDRRGCARRLWDAGAGFPRFEQRRTKIGWTSWDRPDLDQESFRIREDFWKKFFPTERKAYETFSLTYNGGLYG